MLIHYKCLVAHKIDPLNISGLFQKLKSRNCQFEIGPDARSESGVTGRGRPYWDLGGR